jgi:hypothetical protein
MLPRSAFGTHSAEGPGQSVFYPEIAAIRDEAQMTHPLYDELTNCESARQELTEPLERLRDAVDNEDQYEVEATIRSDLTLIRRELSSLRKDLKSMSASGIEGEELQDRMNDWNDTFDDCDADLSELIQVTLSNVAESPASRS